jgi:hypothetical protein
MFLIIDPGITSGWALMDKTGKIIDSGVVLEEDLGPWEGTMKGRQLEGVVIEELVVPTLSPMNIQLKRIIGSFDRMFPHAVKIPPGTWKNSPVAKQPIDILPKPLIHTRDAIHLGWFVLSTNVDFVRSGIYTPRKS